MSLYELPDELLRKILIFTMDRPRSFINLSSTCKRLLYLAESLTRSPEWEQKRPVTFRGSYKKFETFLNSKYRRFSTLRLTYADGDSNVKNKFPSFDLKQAMLPNWRLNLETVVELNLECTNMTIELAMDVVELLPKIRYLKFGHIDGVCCVGDFNPPTRSTFPRTLKKLTMYEMTKPYAILKMFPPTTLEIGGNCGWCWLLECDWDVSRTISDICRYLREEDCVTNHLIFQEFCLKKVVRQSLEDSFKHIKMFFERCSDPYCICCYPVTRRVTPNGSVHYLYE